MNISCGLIHLSLSWFSRLVIRANSTLPLPPAVAWQWVEVQPLTRADRQSFDKTSLICNLLWIGPAAPCGRRWRIRQRGAWPNDETPGPFPTRAFLA